MRTQVLVGLAVACLVLPVGAAGRVAAKGGWQTHTVATGGFSLAVPTSWIDVASHTAQARSAIASTPALQPFAVEAAASSLIKLLAVDPSTLGRVSTNVSVGVGRVGKVDPKAFVANQVAQIVKAGLSKGRVATSTVRLPAGTAVAVTLVESISGKQASVTQYDLVENGVAYVLTFSTRPQLASSNRATFLRSARSFRILPAVDLSDVVLRPSQVGAGYRLKQRPDGRGVIGYATLDLCDLAFPSDQLRTGRLQVDYVHRGTAGVGVSNEVVTYEPGGGQEALREVQGAAAACARSPVQRRQGANHLSFRAEPLSTKRLLPGSVAVRVHITGAAQGKRVDTSVIAVYQVEGDVLSAVYTYPADKIAAAQQSSIALHAARESIGRLKQYQHAA